jgi:FSR family fosmidomycin resistance protein-like MFS transporter
MLFVFLVARAVGVLIGSIAGDRIGRYCIIWISVLGPLPFTLLLPYADFFWTGALTVLISLIIASAFASILIYAIELMPERIGLIGGLFYGLNFGLAGIAAAVLGDLADSIGIESVYRICAFLPLVVLLTWFLLRIEEGHLANQGQVTGEQQRSGHLPRLRPSGLAGAPLRAPRARSRDGGVHPRGWL